MAKAVWAVACAVAVAAWLVPVCGRCQQTKPAGTEGWELHGLQSPASRPADAGAAPVQGQQRPAGPSSPATAAAADYRIGAEDVLNVSVWDNRELTLSVVVRPDGYISFPLVQDVRAEGLTAAELASLILSKLLAFVKEPQVSVIVTQVNAPKVYVIGNVNKPGPIPLRGDLSVLQALSMAGGFTEFASTRNIRIVREGASRQEIRKVNYKRLIENGGEGNYLLKSGDTIVVP